MRYLLNGESSKRLDFRLLDQNDFDNWLKFFQDDSSTQYLNLTTHPDPTVRCRAWFEKVFYRYEYELGGMNVLIDKESGAFVGQCGLMIQHINGKEELEIGYAIMPEFRNAGYASEAAQRCRDYAFQQGFKESLISIIHPENIYSQKVAKGVGMELEEHVDYQGMKVAIFRIASPS